MADETHLSIGKTLRKNARTKSCPICKQEVTSDATKMQACALCGMVLDKQNIMLLVEDGEENYFCLHGCYEKYISINKTEEVIK